MLIDRFRRRARIEKEIRAGFADFVATAISKVDPESIVALNFYESSRTEAQDTALHLWCLGALEYFCETHELDRAAAIGLYREHMIAFRGAMDPAEADGVLRALGSYLPILAYAVFIDRGRNCAKSWAAGTIADPSSKLQAALESARSLPGVPE